MGADAAATAIAVANTQRMMQHTSFPLWFQIYLCLCFLAVIAIYLAWFIGDYMEWRKRKKRQRERET